MLGLGYYWSLFCNVIVDINHFLSILVITDNRFFWSDLPLFFMLNRGFECISTFVMNLTRQVTLTDTCIAKKKNCQGYKFLLFTTSCIWNSVV